VNPLTDIAQITYLIFLRRLDEEQQLQEKKVNLAGIPKKGTTYTGRTEGLVYG